METSAIFSKVSSNSFQVKKKEVKISGGLYGSQTFFHIFITIKWQFNQRNEYCILIGVICTRISCIIHSGGDHRWVSRRSAAADASGGNAAAARDFALSRSRLTSEKKQLKTGARGKNMLLILIFSTYVHENMLRQFSRIELLCCFCKINSK